MKLKIEDSDLDLIPVIYMKTRSSPISQCFDKLDKLDHRVVQK